MSSVALTLRAAIERITTMHNNTATTTTTTQQPQRQQQVNDVQNRMSVATSNRNILEDENVPLLVDNKLKRAPSSSTQHKRPTTTTTVDQTDDKSIQTDPFFREDRTKNCWNTMLGCMESFTWRKLCSCICKPPVYKARTIRLGGTSHEGGPFPKNVVRNQKYSIITFIPMVLLEQFMYFSNMYFLLTALSQAIPMFKIGMAFGYWGPLVGVIAVTMLREAYDDFNRWRRDREMNNKRYTKLVNGGTTKIPSSGIEVGDLLVIHKDQRVPADCVLLRTTERQGACFVRTDQLDGETDWKMRLALSATQALHEDNDVYSLNANVYADQPHCDLHTFIGTYTQTNADNTEHSLPIDIDHTIWADMVLASGSALCMVIYTGRETRAVMNASTPHSKIGKLDYEINDYMKILFAMVLVLSILMVVIGDKGFILSLKYLVRYILLFANIIPISLRVNLDLAKIVYAWFIMHDKQLQGTIVRNSTISEELGRISYLLSDKTGTLTKNEMVFKKLHLGTVSYGADSFADIKLQIGQLAESEISATPSTTTRRYSLSGRLRQAVQAVALCHNVTPYYDDDDGSTVASVLDSSSCDTDTDIEADRLSSQSPITYQGASPDEMALVSWSSACGMTLIQRDLHTMTLRQGTTGLKHYRILHIFPFSSESKRMGIILQDEETDQITFYLKGADTVMRNYVSYNDWLDEECSNMAREGLRTLCVAQKYLSQDEYRRFNDQLSVAKLALKNRQEKTERVREMIEKDMQLLCITGVEDALQDEVRTSLEVLQGAGIKVWMLTGDKQETALCIAKSSGLFGKQDEVFVFKQVSDRKEAREQLEQLRRKTSPSLVISGTSLKICIDHYETELAELICSCKAVVCCRCSPEQKAQLVKLLKKYRNPERVAAVGDGGNDVHMIQTAHAGIGIEAKEGKQASLAADFSISTFSHLQRLLLVHGRYCYRRSSSVSLFIIHRGLIITAMQIVFSFVFYFSSVALYQGFLLMGYSTWYTSLPAFAIILDKDIKETVAEKYPELYKELAKGRLLTLKTFLIWVVISFYQGSIVMYGALLLFTGEFNRIVSITFTALVLTELITIGVVLHSLHWLMLVAELLSLAIYTLSLFVLPDFDVHYILSWPFVWKVLVVTLVSCVPLYMIKILRGRISPATYQKVR